MSRIAILEDSSSLRMLLSEILKKRGYTVETFECLKEAEVLFSNPPDLFISDIRLADGNGIDFLERMQEALAGEAPPVLLLSALGSEEDMLRGFDAGAAEYLTKPVSMGELLAKCSLLLSRKKKSPSSSGEVDVAAKLPGGQLAFGRYRVEKTLGSGSFGAVYAAHDTETNQRVALKVLHALRGSELQHRQRFLRESYTLSLVKSRHVVSLIDFGEQEGRLYAALEFVEGPTLSKTISRYGPMGDDELFALLNGCAEALEAMSKQGLVHRDIKPDNVILRGGNPADPVLIDFGLAKSSGDRMLTEVGTLLGTPAFMSPEQISARDLDSRTDQFSLALTVRYAATGETAFPRLTGVQLLAAISTQAVQFPASMHPNLRKCLTRMTRIQPERRYGSVRALLRDLSSPIDPPVVCG
ncbi:MAG: protein kinase [Planctomycetota bacterium]